MTKKKHPMAYWERKVVFEISGKAGELSIRELTAMVAYGETWMKSLRAGKIHPLCKEIRWDSVKEMAEISLGLTF